MSCFFIFSFLLTAGFGCKGLTSEQQAATKSVTLEYWTVFDDVDALQALLDQYRAERPFITVNLRQLRESELYPRLVEALAEDKGPDIISVHSRYLRAWQSKLAPMPAAVRDTTMRVVKGQLSSQTIVSSQGKTLLTPERLDREYVQTVKKDVTLDGKIYGLPLSLDTMALYYNKDLLDRAGVPEPPKNWDEFSAAVKKIVKYNKETGKIIQAGAALGAADNVPFADDLLYILFQQSEVEFVSKSGAAIFNIPPQNRDYGVDTPAMSIMNFYTDFANPTRDTYTWNARMDNALDRFTSGALAFFFGYSHYYPLIKARAPQLNLVVTPLPQLNEEQPVNSANYWVQAVVGKSKYQEEAWGLIDFLAHSKATKDYLDRTGRPSALRAYINEQSQKAELAPFVGQLLTAENWYRGRNYEAARRAIAEMTRDWLNPPAEEEKVMEYKQNLLNTAASRVNQTM